MKTTDFTKKITSAHLAENLEKQFSSRVNLTKYNREQLEDIRNKLRTRIFQQEGTARFNDLLTNETYQKDKAMLELLNTRIKEMLGEQMQKLRDKMSQLSEAKKAKPDFLDLDKDGNKKEPMKKAAKDAKVKEAIKKDKKELEGNAFGKAVSDAKKDGIQTGEKVKVGGKEYPVKEGFPTVDSARAEHEKNKTTGKFDSKKISTGTVYTKKHTKADAEETPAAKSKKVKEEMKVGDKKQSSTGGTIEKTKTGVKHTAGKNYSAEKQPFNRNTKDLGEAKAHAKDCDCKECMMQEGSTGDYSAKKAAAGKDIGKPGKQFSKIASKSGGGEKGERIAGAVLKKLRAKESMSESNANYKHNVKFVNESLQFLLNEDEEGKAQAITAAGDMVNDFTGWMQRVGQYQTKAIIELSDQIKSEFGQAEAEAFKQSVGPALSATLETLTQQRETISNAVAVLAGGAAPEAPMGMEPDMAAPMEPGLDAAMPDEMNPSAGDEFGASDAAVGGDVTSGREMRESRQQSRQQSRARKLAESHSIMSKLAR